MSDWLLIRDYDPLPGAWNMSVDEYCFQVLAGEGTTVLRFYSWERPTASLGYSQKIDRVVDRDFCRSNGIDIVRRVTGGKLVLHHRELTYSVCSADTGTFGATLPESYRRISEALMLGLHAFGLEPKLADSPPIEYVRGNLPCFSYPAKDEIEVGGSKIVGSAQKRIGDRFLQHGSIPLIEDDDLLERISFLKSGRERIRMISLSRALGREVSFAEAADKFSAGFEEFFGVRLTRKTLDPEDKAAVRDLCESKHAHPDWINGVSPPD